MTIVVSVDCRRYDIVFIESLSEKDPDIVRPFIDRGTRCVAEGTSLFLQR